MELQIIDTHTHLYSNSFSQNIDKVIERAEAEGVHKFYLPAIDSETHEAMLQLESRYPGKCIAMMGLHPCSVKEDYQKELDIIAGWLEKRKFVAVGEIGIDYYWDRNFDVQQADAFHQQIEWALHYKIPIVIHSRESMDVCIKIVQEHQKGALGGIFHCFTGTASQARQIIDAGLYLGIGGVLTYKKSELPDALKDIPLESLVLETDAPYLPPVPYRGKRNESSYLRYIVDKLAEVKQVSREEVAKITTANAQKIFGW